MDPFYNDPRRTGNYTNPNTNIKANSAWNKIKSTLSNDWNVMKNTYGTFSGARNQGTGLKMAATEAQRNLLSGMGKGAKGRLGGYAAAAAAVPALAAWGLSGD